MSIKKDLGIPGWNSIMGVWFWLVIFSFTSGCRQDEEFIPPGEVEISRDLFLTEYWEEGDLVLQFNFEDTLLVNAIQYEREGVLDYKLEYNNFNYKPNRMTAEVNNRVLYLQFDYDSRGNVLGYTFFVDRYIRYIIRLYYDEDGQISELRKYWPLNGELIKRKFKWEQGNIVRIEQSSNFIEPTNALVAEYVYDEKSNPFTPLFGLIGFNIIEEVPLTQNNPLEIKKYWKENPRSNEISKIKYAYGRFGFPFFKEVTTRDTRGNQSVIYGEYKY